MKAFMLLALSLILAAPSSTLAAPVTYNFILSTGGQDVFGTHYSRNPNFDPADPNSPGELREPMNFGRDFHGHFTVDTARVAEFGSPLVGVSGHEPGYLVAQPGDFYDFYVSIGPIEWFSDPLRPGQVRARNAFGDGYYFHCETTLSGRPSPCLRIEDGLLTGLTGGIDNNADNLFLDLSWQLDLGGRWDVWGSSLMDPIDRSYFTFVADGEFIVEAVPAVPPLILLSLGLCAGAALLRRSRPCSSSPTTTVSAST
jgi:hypothetical protein